MQDATMMHRLAKRTANALSIRLTLHWRTGEEHRAQHQSDHLRGELKLDAKGGRMSLWRPRTHATRPKEAVQMTDSKRRKPDDDVITDFEGVIVLKILLLHL